jgi:hypothetical protein
MRPDTKMMMPRTRTTSGERGVDAVKKSDMPKTMHGQQEPNVFYPDSASYLAEEKRPSAKKREKQRE